MVTCEFLARRFNVMRILFGIKPKTKQPVVKPGETLLAR